MVIEISVDKELWISITVDAGYGNFADYEFVNYKMHSYAIGTIYSSTYHCGSLENKLVHILADINKYN